MTTMGLLKKLPAVLRLMTCTAAVCSFGGVAQAQFWSRYQMQSTPVDRVEEDNARPLGQSGAAVIPCADQVAGNAVADTENRPRLRGLHDTVTVDPVRSDAPCPKPDRSAASRPVNEIDLGDSVPRVNVGAAAAPSTPLAGPVPAAPAAELPPTPRRIPAAPPREVFGASQSADQPTPGPVNP